MKFARGTKAAHYGALTKAEGASASGNEEEGSGRTRATFG